MPRIRTIKPDFFTSEAIARIASYRARLTFIGLWTHVDDAGRCRDNPKLIRAALWPLDDSVTVDCVGDDLAYLAQCGRIIRYTGTPDGGPAPVPLLAVVGFEEHQRISKPTPSKLPPPPAHGAPPPHDDTSGKQSNRTTPAVNPPSGVREDYGSPTGDVATCGNGIPVGLQEDYGSPTGGLPVGREGEQGKEGEGNVRDAQPPRCRRHSNLPADDPGPACVGCRSVRVARERADAEARERARRDEILTAQLARRQNGPPPAPGPGRDLARAVLADIRRARSS